MDFLIENGVLKKYLGHDNNVVIPNGVKVIGEEVFLDKKGNFFRKNDEVESVIIPAGVETIERYAFLNCVKLKSITIPNTVKVIEYSAFSGCTELRSITIPGGVKSIGTGAFRCCKFDSVTVPSSVEEIETGAFEGAKEIKVYDNIKSKIARIGEPFFDKEFSYIITILSKDTDEVVSRIPIASDGTYPNRRLIESCESENGKFDLLLLDQNFRKFKSPKVRTFIAEFRLNNPFDLTDDNRDMYAKYLKRTAKQRERDNAEKTFVIKGKTLANYIGIDTMSVVKVPDGIKKIGMKAFCKAVDNTITEIILPEGLTTIESSSDGNNVFNGCKKLKKVVLPDSLINIPFNAFDIDVKNEKSGEWEQVELDFVEYDNGLYLGNDKNPYLCLVKVKNTGIESIKVKDGCKIIMGNVFLHCDRLRIITLPDSLEKIEERSDYEWVTINGSGRDVRTEDIYLKSDLSVNMPQNYFKTTMKLPGTVTYNLLSTKWKDQVTLNDLAWIYLFQSGKKFDDFCDKRFIQKSKAVSEMLSICSDNPEKAAIIKLAKYAYGYKAVIGKDAISELVNLADREKIESEEIKLLKSFAGGNDQDESDELERYCNANYDFKEVEEIIRKSSLNLTEAFKNYPVIYKGTKEKAPEFVVKCVLASYIESFKGVDPKAQIIKDTDDIADNFDKDSFQAFLNRITLRAIGNVERTTRNEFFGVEPIDRLLSLVGRYGDEELLQILINGYDSRRKQYYGYLRTSKVINYEKYIKAAILLNDSDAAMDYCIEKGWGKQYAEIRGKRLPELQKLDLGDSEGNELIEDAISLYEDIVIKLKDLLEEDGTYSDPNVQETPQMAKISSTNAMAEKFFATLRDLYKNKKRMGSYDYRFEPDVLYKHWSNSQCVEEGHTGICLIVGLLVASYLFESKNMSGEMVLCRNKWELRGDASEGTRIALKVDPDINKWKVYVKSGYPTYEM